LEDNTGSQRKDGGRGPASASREPARVGDSKVLPQRARELMMAALGLFARRDFSAVTIKDIAKVAGVNTALIYYYFDNKEDLFRATLDYAVERALENYRRLGERHSDPVDLINDWFDNHAELSEPIRELVKIMLDYRTARTQLRVVDDIINLFYDEECRIISRACGAALRWACSARSIRSGRHHRLDASRRDHGALDDPPRPRHGRRHRAAQVAVLRASRLQRRRRSGRAGGGPRNRQRRLIRLPPSDRRSCCVGPHALRATAPSRRPLCRA
jgi:AcrR family transcriptional regulator